MPVLENVENAQEQIRDTLESVQTRVIQTNKKIANTLASRLPEVPALPLLDNVTGRIPSPTVAVKTYFDLVERATKANRKFAMEIVGAWSEETTTADKAATAQPSAATSQTAAADADSSTEA